MGSGVSWFGAMTEWTLFVDESGRFDLRSPWPSGRRIVGGVLVREAPTEAEASCRRAIDAALATVAPWWRGPVHMRRLRHPPYLAADLIAMPAPAPIVAVARRLPPELPESIARAGQAWRAIWKIAAPIVTALRKVVTAELARRSARFLIVSEYGRNLPPGMIPYPRMLAALVEQAALACALGAPSAATLHPIVAERSGALLIEDFTRWSAALAALARRTAGPSGPRTGTVEIVKPVRAPAEERAGLQVADTIVHSLGPGRTQEVEPTRGEAAAWDRIRLAAEVEALFELPSDAVSERDAVAPHRQVRRAVAEVDRSRGFEECVVELEQLHRAPWPPPGVYRVAVEEAYATSVALKELR